MPYRPICALLAATALISAAPVRAAPISCPPKAAEMLGWLGKLPILSVKPRKEAGMYSDPEQRNYDPRGVNALGATPARIEATLNRDSALETVDFWLADKDRARYASTFPTIVPPMKYPCDPRYHSCSWWKEPRPSMGGLETVELTNSVLVPGLVRFTCRYRSY